MEIEPSKFIRIKIQWNDQLLALGACGGQLKVERLNPINPTEDKILITGKVICERNSMGYEKLVFVDKTITTEQFNYKIKPYIDTMIRSYHRGMLLERGDYNWIPDWKEKND